MIPPSAVKKFVDARRDDHRWLKKLTHVEMDKLLAEFDPRPRYWEDLKLHQKVGLYLGIKYHSFAFWFDMGTGKTLTALELLQYWWDAGYIRRALVFVTSDKAFPTWERQMKQYKLSVPFVSLDAPTSDGKWDILDRFKDGIIFLHYPGTVAQVSERVRSKGKKQKFVLSPEKLDKLLRGVDALVLDESTKCSSHRSLTYELCLAAAKQAPFRYALAGMPFGRDPSLLWPQMNLIDKGASLGPTLGLFREAFFTKKQNYWGGPYSFDYTFKSSMRGKLSDMLQHRSLTYTANECIDLPAVLPLLEEVRLPRENLEYYEQVVRELVQSSGNLRAVKNAFLRMRQISSGFLGLKDDETGDRAEMDFAENPKLDRLMELIDELPSDRKAVIFYEYTHSGRRIVDALHELQHRPIWLWSGTKEPGKDLERFMSSPECRLAVVNNKVGAYSLDGLQVANYEFHFESAVSVIDRTQAERRIIRQGQTRKCFIYDLVARDTADAKILRFHKEGEDLFKALLTHPGIVLRGD